jgi:hypothetical protein
MTQPRSAAQLPTLRYGGGSLSGALVALRAGCGPARTTRGSPRPARAGTARAPLSARRASSRCRDIRPPTGPLTSTLLPMRNRDSGEGGQVVLRVAKHCFDFGSRLLTQHRRDDLELVANVLGVGLGEIVRMAAGTIFGSPQGTTASTKRCEVGPAVLHQAAAPAALGLATPKNTDPIAAFKPVWASEMTSCTLPSPRAFSDSRNAVQDALPPNRQGRTPRPRGARPHRRSVTENRGPERQ